MTTGLQHSATPEPGPLVETPSSPLEVPPASPPATAPSGQADITGAMSATPAVDPGHAGSVATEASAGAGDETGDGHPRTFAPREDRLTRILLIGRLIAATGDHLCRARNISANGMNIECGAPLVRGDRVGIALRNLAVVEGKVAWNDGTRIGIQFDASIDVDTFLRPSDEGTGLTARAPRIAADCAATLWNEGRIAAVRVGNLSQSGCCLIGPAPTTIDTVVRITITGLPPRQATLRWVRDDRAGYAFHTILSFAEIVAWQREQTARTAPTA